MGQRNFSQIIDYELKKNCPTLKSYVRNYSECGTIFHGGQAEILKNVIDKYDIFLIYAGNNEHLPYILSDDWLFLQDEGPITTVLIPFLEKYSRLYAIGTKISGRYVCPVFTRTAFLKTVRKRTGIPDKPRLFETATRVSWDERTKLTAKFKKDLDEIGNLIQSKQKYLIVSSVPINENYKPLFSVVSSDLDESARDRFFRHYKQGVEKFEQGDFSGALISFSHARRLDENVAIVNYMIGQIYLRLGNLEEGRRHLIMSSDYDGFMSRAPSSYWTVVKLIINKYPNVYYADSLTAFHIALDRGVTYEELFADIHHPSLMGHIIIANRFLCIIHQLLPHLRKFACGLACRDLTSIELRGLVSRYRDALRISDQDDSMTALQIARMHLGYSLYFPTSGDYLPIVEANALKFFQKSDKTPQSRAKMCIFQAIIETARENLTKACGYLNEALVLSPSIVWYILSEPLMCNDSAFNVFKRAGISYSGTEDKFVLKATTP